MLGFGSNETRVVPMQSEQIDKHSSGSAVAVIEDDRQHMLGHMQPERIDTISNRLAGTTEDARQHMQEPESLGVLAVANDGDLQHSQNMHLLEKNATAASSSAVARDEDGWEVFEEHFFKSDTVDSIIAEIKCDSAHKRTNELCAKLLVHPSILARPSTLQVFNSMAGDTYLQIKRCICPL